jgi:hypothetical protein
MYIDFLFVSSQFFHDVLCFAIEMSLFRLLDDQGLMRYIPLSDFINYMNMNNNQQRSVVGRIVTLLVISYLSQKC